MFECFVCGSRNLVYAKSFRDYPLTNIYEATPYNAEQWVGDIEVLECSCGHLQSISQTKSDQLYTSSYAYNGVAPGVIARRNTGIALMEKYLASCSINTLVDIGCGQLEMISLMKTIFSPSRIIGMDPVPLRSHEVSGVDVEFYNEYFTGRNVVIQKNSGPNLFVLDNVLEHIENLHQFLFGLSETACDGDYLYICVPSKESMYKKLQFHELIHEHVHYFSIEDINFLLTTNGFECLESFTDFGGARGYNFHLFKKSVGPVIKFPHTNRGRFSELYPLYLQYLSNTLGYIDSLRSPVWGVCASELTPTLAYHMGTDLRFCGSIFDSTPSKDCMYMPGIKPRIESMDNMKFVSPDDFFFVTAPSIARSVISNLARLGVFNIVLPTPVL